MSTLAIPEARPSASTFGSRGLVSLVLLLVCTLFSAAPAWAQTQVGTLSVVNPTYLAIDTDASGTRWLYVSNHGDVGGNTGGVVYKFNLTTGSQTGIALSSHGTGAGPGQAQFISPDGIGIDPATHDLYVSDRYLNRIVRMHNDGTFVMTWGTGTVGAINEMHGPSGIAVDAAGAVYVAEHGDYNGDPNHDGQHVAKYTISGTTATQDWRKGSYGNGQLQFNSTGPYGVALSGSSVYVADAFNFRVQVLSTADGSYQTEFSTGSVAEPLGLSIDSSGNLWAGETSNDSAGNFNGQGSLQQAQAFSLSGTPTGMVLPGTPGSLSAFHAVVDGTSNKAYVSDYQNSRVVIFNLSGSTGPSVPVVSNASVSGTVGTPISTVTVSATNSPTSFSAPELAGYGLAIDASGNITGTPTATATNAAVAVTATNAAGTSQPATITLNLASSFATSGPTGPVVTSFNFVPHTLQFQIHFSEPVTGVTMNSFVFTQEGLAAGHGTFDSVTTVDPQTYNLNITFIAGTETNPAAPGAFRFDIKSSGSGIVGVTSGLPYSGAGVTAAVCPVTPHLETDAPLVGSFAPDTPAGNTVNFVVTFNKGTFNLQPSNVSFNTTGTATATLGYIQPAANDNDATVFDIPVTFGGSGTISVTLTGATGTISDGNYNYYVGPDTSQVFTIPTSSGGSAPVVNNAVVSGTVGSSITPVQVYASGSPTSFAASDLAQYGLSISSSGLITGTPGATANGVQVAVTATNSAGTSAPAAITLYLNMWTSAGNPPVVSNTTVNGTVGTAITPVTVSATNSPTSFSAPGLSAVGLAINNAGVISGTPTAPATNATAQVTVTNAYGSTTGNITVNIASAPSNNPPVVTNASVSGTVGTAISPVTVSATNSPTNFVANGLTAYGLTISSGGVITGTPTAVASGATVQVTATNGFGSGSGTITLNIAASSPGGNPPVVSNASVNGTVGVAITPVTVSATNSPTSFSATGLAAYGLTISNSGVISGTPSTTAAGATVNVTASNSHGLSNTATITLNIAAAGPAPTITSASSASATVGNSFSYQITASPAAQSYSADNLSGTGLAINQTTGVIYGTPLSAGTITTHLHATNSGGTSAAFTLTITVTGSTPPPPPPPALQDQHLVFLAPTSTLFVGDSFTLAATNSSGLPITYTVVSGPATISGNTLLITGSTPVVVRASSAGNSTYASASADATLVATRKNQIIVPPQFPAVVHTDAGSLTLDATVNSGLPVTYSIVSGNATISGNKLVFTGSGNITVQATQAGNDTFAPSTSTFTLTANPVPRLVNISSRLRVSAGDADGASIVGFAVTGDKPKQILIRAVGPSLKAFGLSSLLPNPTLTLFDSKNTIIGTNSGWGDDAAISAAGDKVYAFQLGAGSKDAALLVTLQPGTYTAQVQSADNSGTVLVEVYDVSATDAVPTKQLINISTRGTVGTGDNVLIGGFSVSGNEPKKVLIRAVGPGLTGFGVAGAVADPIITVYSGTKVVGQNDNWGTEDASLTGSAAADIAAAATASGAFPLASGSADAAVVLTLQPGQYSAVVTGANNSTGAAMVEVYEIPDATK